MSAQPLVSVASRYQILSQNRRPYEERAKACAKLTVPAAYPLTDAGGDSSSTKITTPYQGVGAEGVNTLAAKLLLALMPPNTPFFRFVLADKVKEDLLTQQEGKETMTRMERALGGYEQSIQTCLEAFADRPGMYECLLQLLIAGNALLYLDPDNGVRVWRLPSYVVRRDATGKPLEIITLEKAEASALPGGFLETGQEDGGASTEKTYDLYTYVVRKERGWDVWQECLGKEVPESRGSYKPDHCPFLPLRMYRVDGESYGRSYVENYLGDLKSLEALTQAALEGAAGAAKLLFLVKPNGSTRVETLQNAKNCAVVTGDAADVTVLSVGKATDFQTASAIMDKIQHRLSKAFLLVDGIRRDAERVTAEEIRAVASELESALGGVYSLLSQEYQMPYIRVRIEQLTKAKRIPPMPKDTVTPAIVAGFEALGRGNDRAKIEEFLLTAGGVLTPQLLPQFLNIPNLLQRLATAGGINPDGLLKTAEDMEQESQAAASQQTQNTMMPKVMDIAGKGIANLPPEMMQEALSGLAENSVPPDAV